MTVKPKGANLFSFGASAQPPSHAQYVVPFALQSCLVLNYYFTSPLV